MAYVRSKRNIRRPRRRRSVRRRAPTAYRRRTTTRMASSRKKPCVCPGELSPAAKFALAQIDPFEPKCLGAKVPDSNTIPSIANADTDQISLAAPSANGNLIAVAFSPSYAAATNVATDGSGSVTWNSGNWSTRRNYTNVVGSIEAIRPVSHALRVSSPLAPTSTVGFVHIGLAVESRISSSTGFALDLPKTVNDMTGLAHYARFTLASLTQSPVTVINKWIDETGFRYDDPRSGPVVAAPTTSNTTVQTIQNTLNFGQSWATIVVMVEGQSTGSSPISFEHLLLTECIPRKDAFILGSAAAPHSPGTMSAVSTMTAEGGFSHTEAQQDSYTQQMLSNLTAGAMSAGEQVFQNVAVPLMQRVGQVAVNSATNYAIQGIVGLAGIAGVNSNANRLRLN